MTIFKNLVAALVLAALTTGATAADPPKAFEVGKGFSLEKGYSLAPDAAPTARTETRTDAVVDPLWFACRIVVDHGDGTGSVGSGTPVWSENGKTLIVTNAHVVPRHRSTRPITVHASGRAFAATYRDGSEVTEYLSPEGRSMVRVSGPDLAILEVDAELGHVELADEVPPVGAQVWQFGYGGSLMTEGPTVKSGTVTRGLFVEPTMVNSINAVGGDSGSGVFNTNGELVGVTWGFDSVRLQACAVELGTLRKFAGRPLLAKLFPRFAARAEARRSAKEAANLPPASKAPPTVERKGKIDPKLAAPSKEAPKAKAPADVPQAPFGTGIPPAPPGEGWQWDGSRKVWWKYTTPVQGVQGGVQGNCPGGVCPAPSQPSSRFRRW